jgi:hypothetical protein
MRASAVSYRTSPLPLAIIRHDIARGADCIGYTSFRMMLWQLLRENTIETILECRAAGQRDNAGQLTGKSGAGCWPIRSGADR